MASATITPKPGNERTIGGWGLPLMRTLSHSLTVDRFDDIPGTTVSASYDLSA